MSRIVNRPQHDRPMAKEYLERLETVLRPVARTLPPEVELAIKHFFSGAAAYA